MLLGLPSEIVMITNLYLYVKISAGPTKLSEIEIKSLKNETLTVQVVLSRPRVGSFPMGSARFHFATK